MEGVLRWKEVIIKAGIAFCVAVLLLALAYISSRMRLVEPPPAVAHPRVQIPEAERANIAATEERMRELQSAWAAQVGVATAELKKKERRRKTGRGDRNERRRGRPAGACLVLSPEALLTSIRGKKGKHTNPSM